MHAPVKTLYSPELCNLVDRTDRLQLALEFRCRVPRNAARSVRIPMEVQTTACAATIHIVVAKWMEAMNNLDRRVTVTATHVYERMHPWHADAARSAPTSRCRSSRRDLPQHMPAGRRAGHHCVAEGRSDDVSAPRGAYAHFTTVLGWWNGVITHGMSTGDNRLLSLDTLIALHDQTFGDFARRPGNVYSFRGFPSIPNPPVTTPTPRTRVAWRDLASNICDCTSEALNNATFPCPTQEHRKALIRCYRMQFLSSMLAQPWIRKNVPTKPLLDNPTLEYINLNKALGADLPFHFYEMETGIRVLAARTKPRAGRGEPSGICEPEAPNFCASLGFKKYCRCTNRCSLSKLKGGAVPPKHSKLVQQTLDAMFGTDDDE